MGTSWISRKRGGGDFRKGRVDLEKGGYAPLLPTINASVRGPTQMLIWGSEIAKGPTR